MMNLHRKPDAIFQKNDLVGYLWKRTRNLGPLNIRSNHWATTFASFVFLKKKKKKAGYSLYDPNLLSLSLSSSSSVLPLGASRFGRQPDPVEARVRLAARSAPGVRQRRQRQVLRHRRQYGGRARVTLVVVGGGVSRWRRRQSGRLVPLPALRRLGPGLETRRVQSVRRGPRYRRRRRRPYRGIPVVVHGRRAVVTGRRRCRLLQPLAQTVPVRR